MACFTLTIGREEFRITSPFTANEMSSDIFIRTLQHAGMTDPELIPALLAAIKTEEDDKRSSIPESKNSSDIAHIMQYNMSKLGVTMEVLSDEEWDEYCTKNNIKKDSQAFLHEGIIYTKSSGFKKSNAMHEFSHLILAYFKQTDLKRFSEFIDTLSTNEMVQSLIKRVQEEYAAQNLPYTYLDAQEEAIVQYIEKWFDDDFPLDLEGQSVYIQNIKVDMLGYMSTTLRKPIKQLFGLKQDIGLATFFNSLLVDIPTYGCELFTGHPIETIGYNKNKEEVKKTQQIKKLIDYCLQTKKLTKLEDC